MSFTPKQGQLVALVVATPAPAMPRSRLPILRVCSMKDQTRKTGKNILTNKITFTQESQSSTFYSELYLTI